MAVSKKTPVDAFRRRQKRAGNVRLELNVAKEDVALVRGVAQALSDPQRQGEIRNLLRARLTTQTASFKEFLLSAPLDGIDLTRSPDTGRDVDL